MSQSESRQATTRRALVVVGVHRSGTSAITRVLGLAGASLPRVVMPANEANERGYFESRAIYEAHEELFAERGSAWDDLAPFPPARWRSEPWAEEWIDRFASLLESEFGDSPLFVLKDPRICRLLPIWQAALERMKIEASYVVTVRNPLEVASSLKRRYQMRHHRGLALWLDHLICAEEATRELPRHFLAYDALLADWRAALARLESELGLTLPGLSPEAEAEIDGFLDPSLRHHARSLAELEEQTPLADWVRTAYAWAEDAAAGKAPAREPLERVAMALRDAERAFGPLLAAEGAGHREARSRLSRRLERVQDARDSVIARLADRDRELSRSALWIRNLFSFAVKTRWGESPPGDMMQGLLGVLKAADPGQVPELASAELRWIDGAAEVNRLERALAELEHERASEGALHEQEVAALREELAALAPQLEAAVHESRAQALHSSEVGTQLGVAEAAISGLEGRIAELEAQLRQTQIDLADRDHVIEQLGMRSERMEASLLWRGSRPLRAAGSWFRAALGR